MQPFDYRIAVQDPLQMALAGYQQGQQFQQQRVQAERETQLYDMEMQQYQANQAKLQEEQARAKQVQANMADMFERVDTGTWSEGDTGRFLAENPEVGEPVAAYLQGISEKQKMTGVKDQTRLLMMLNAEAGPPSEDSQVAMLLKERKAAAEAAGMPDQATAAEATLMEYLNTPAALKASLMTNVAITAPEAWKVIEPLVVRKPVERKTVTTDEGVFAVDLAAEDVAAGMQRLGGAPETSPLVTIDQGNKAEQTFAVEMAKLDAGDIAAVSTQGQTARRNAQTLNELQTALASSPSGAEAALVSILGNVGIATESTGDVQWANSLISKLIPGQRAPGSGPMSDKDIDLFRASLPRLINTPGGNAKILSTMIAMNNYMIREGELADEVKSGAKTRDQYRKEIQALGNPLAEFSGPPIGTVEDGFAFQGGDPADHKNWKLQ